MRDWRDAGALGKWGSENGGEEKWLWDWEVKLVLGCVGGFGLRGVRGFGDW